MIRINDNYGKLLLLFTKGPARSILDNILIEREYYLSEDSMKFGAIVFDSIDNNYSIALHKKNKYYQYKHIYSKTDITTLGKARSELFENMNSVDTIDVDTYSFKGIDLFSPIARPSQISPIFKMLNDNEFFSPAKCVMEEFAKYFEDADNNFVDQFQSINGHDARVWELFLLCFLREQGFTIDKSKAVPDFVIEKMEHKVAIEAVIASRRDKTYRNELPDITIDEMYEKLDNEIPLMFGSTLYSKLQHKIDNKRYWELDHVKDIPFVLAMEDFHEDMSMMWTFPAITSILYGIEQNVRIKGEKVELETINGKRFKKGEVEITPLFLDKQYENVSAILFSTTGTIPKFNRMGRQAGLGSPNLTFLQSMCCYNKDENAIFPDYVIRVVDETCNEKWSDGVAIFHNPMAKNPLDPKLFPNVAHHYYKDGLLHSDMPEHFCMSSFLWNVKGGNIGKFIPKVQKFYGKYHEVKKVWWK